MNLGTDTITLPYSLKDGPLANGETVKYFSGSGQAIGGLQDGGTYYARDVAGSSFRLSSKEDLSDLVNLTSNGTGTEHSILREGETPEGNSAELSADRAATAAATTVKGVAVTAVNTDQYATIGISGGFGSVAVNIGGAVNVISATTTAYIGNGAKVNEVNTSLVTDQAVLVAAANDLWQLGVAGALAIGSVAVAPGAAVLVADVTVDAFIGANAVVNVNGDVVVKATSVESIIAIAAGLAGGADGERGRRGLRARPDAALARVHRRRRPRGRRATTSSSRPATTPRRRSWPAASASASPPGSASRSASP